MNCVLNDWSTYNTLTIDGQAFLKSDLINLSNEKLQQVEIEAHEWSFWKFINEWFNDEIDHIAQKTSGSTGKPKEIKLLKKHMVNSALNTLQFFQLQEGNSALLCLSSDYVGGKMMLVRSIVGGLNLTMSKPSSNPLSQVEIRNKSFDFAAMVPTQLYSSLESNQLNRLKNVIIGGAAIKSVLIGKMENTKCHIYATYGMTETVSHIALKKMNHSKEKEHFNVLPNISIALDHRNCLLINAPGITSKSLQTNDVINLVDEQTFEWLGRADNVVNSGAYKIQIETLEEKVTRLLKTQVYFSKRKDEKLGEKLVLILDDAAIKIHTHASILRMLKLHLHPYELPKEFIHGPTYPYSSNGKILRSEL